MDVLQVRQWLGEPEQVAQDPSQSIQLFSRYQKSGKKKGCIPMQVRLSLGETNVPEGQLSIHVPFDDRNVPGKHPVHTARSTME